MTKRIFPSPPSPRSLKPDTFLRDLRVSFKSFVLRLFPGLTMILLSPTIRLRLAVRGRPSIHVYPMNAPVIEFPKTPIVFPNNWINSPQKPEHLAVLDSSAPTYCVFTELFLFLVHLLKLHCFLFSFLALVRPRFVFITLRISHPPHELRLSRFTNTKLRIPITAHRMKNCFEMPVLRRLSAGPVLRRLFRRACPAVLFRRACPAVLFRRACPKNSWQMDLRIVSIDWVLVFFISFLRNFWDLGLGLVTVPRILGGLRRNIRASFEFF